MDKLGTWNAALDAIGHDPLTTLTDAVPAQKVLNRQFEPALKSLLRQFPWNWAKTQAAFDAISGTPLVQWTNQFAVPADLVTMLAINETYPDTPSDLWEIVRLNGNRVLLTDQEDCNAEYIYLPSDSELDDFLDEMDPLAHDALVTLLASRISTKLAKDGRGMANNLLDQYLRVDLPRARVKAGNEQREYVARNSLTSLNALARTTFTNP